MRKIDCEEPKKKKKKKSINYPHIKKEVRWMGEAGFSVHIQKVRRYLQVIALETQDICGTLIDIIRAILSRRVPPLYLTYRCSQRKLKNQELLYFQKQRKRGLYWSYTVQQMLSSPCDQLLHFSPRPISYQNYFLALHACTISSLLFPSHQCCVTYQC